MELLTGPKLTDKEVEEGAPLRDAFREDVLKKQALFSTAPDVFADTPELKQATQLQKHIEKELAWINANVEVSPRMITSRQREFNEGYDKQYSEFLTSIKTSFMDLEPVKKDAILMFLKDSPDVVKTLTAKVEAEVKQEQNNQAEEKARKLKRGFGEIVADAWTNNKGKLYRYLFYFFLLCVGLRAASFAANDNIWRPIPMRILFFVYTFILIPVTFPYYLYREIRGLFSKDPDMVPHLEGLLPITPYDSSVEEPTISQRLFGYKDTDGLRQWIQRKIEVYNQEREDSLVSTMLSSLKEAEAASKQNPE